jgi:hypothetical protein
MKNPAAAKSPSFNEQFVLRKSGNLIPLWRQADKIDHRCE